ncbi:hypothetical protein H072_234 [Dactylellina haptotyla CBS 200.50]|uniref:Uncharacterized protein n=1 Tax=Dactylellina haptotyla (strain CBS 200.50) TaxID=1284197 RepID=S8C2D4_DACHA|nr:hypothetical protein H072_234 [Dactylellina haptotyla CBS 200.50]
MYSNSREKREMLRNSNRAHPNGQRVGITIPIISNRVHWFENVENLKGLLDGVVSRNPILEPKRISILIDGKRGMLYDPIPPGSILQAQYFFHQIGALGSQRKVEPVKESAEVPRLHAKHNLSSKPPVPIANLPSMEHTTPADLLLKMIDGKQTVLSQDNQAVPEVERLEDQENKGYQNESFMIRFNIEMVCGKGPVDVKAMPDSIIRGYYSYIRKILLQRQLIHPMDRLHFEWPQVQNNPTWSDTVSDVIEDTPAGINTFIVNVTKTAFNPSDPVTDIVNSVANGKSKSFTDLTKKKFTVYNPPDVGATSSRTGVSTQTETKSIQETPSPYVLPLRQPTVKSEKEKKTVVSNWESEDLIDFNIIL